MKVKILFIGTVWPEPRSSAAGVRTLALVDQCVVAGFDVHFASPSISNAYEIELKNRNITTHSVQSNDTRFDGWIKELDPAIVVFDRFILEEQFGWRVRENVPEALTVIDTQDLHFLRSLREETLRRDSSQESLEKIFKADLDFLNHDTCIRELASIYRSDLSILISSFESDLLLRRFGIPGSSIITIPFSYQNSESLMTPYSARKNFVMIGNFRHPPNLDSFYRMRDTIWPKIRSALPKAELHVYGAYPPKDVMESNREKSGFIVKGPASESIPTLSQYKALLAPLRFGAGIKGKIADAWAAETPVVTTPIGSEGMTLQGEFPGLVSKTADEFIQNAIRLGGEDAASIQAALGLTKLGSVAFSKLFGWERNARLWIETLENALKNRNSIREKNIIGRILQYEGHQSKRYLSKWIEEKNKREK